MKMEEIKERTKVRNQVEKLITDLSIRINWR